MNLTAPRDIDDAAVAWAVRLDADDLEAAETARLQAWLASDPRHQGALLRAEAALRLMTNSPAEQARPTSPVRRERRWAWRGMAVGAGLSALIAASAVVAVMSPRPGVYHTQVGEQRRVMLDDGSIAMVNTDSRLRVRYADGERRIKLVEGEAWFQVAKNPARPFIVDAGDVHVQATGTAFSVRRQGAATEVIVTEGAVMAWKSDGVRVPIRAGQGAQVEAQGDAVRVASANAASVLAWRDGHLVLDGMTVGQAAEELNRYNAKKIIVVDPAVRSHRMVGLFLINKPEEFVEAVVQVTGSKASDDGRNAVIG